MVQPYSTNLSEMVQPYSTNISEMIQPYSTNILEMVWKKNIFLHIFQVFSSTILNSGG